MSDPPARDKRGGGVLKALRRFARKLRESARVLGDEYRAGRDEGDDGIDESGDGIDESGSEELRKIPHRDLGSVNEEPPPSS